MGSETKQLSVSNFASMLRERESDSHFAPAEGVSILPPPNASKVSLLNVDYTRLRTRDGSDLYLTKYGLPFWRHLLPENWHEKEWFESKRERLRGTSTVYKVPTKKLEGASLQMVVKWSRVGEDIPMDTFHHFKVREFRV